MSEAATVGTSLLSVVDRSRMNSTSALTSSVGSSSSAEDTFGSSMSADSRMLACWEYSSSLNESSILIFTLGYLELIGSLLGGRSYCK